MALNKTTLGTALKAAIKTAFITEMDAEWPTTGLDDSVKAAAIAQREAFGTRLSNAIGQAVADEVIQHFIDHAVVATLLDTTVVNVTSVGGVTPGAGSSGAGTGTLSGVGGASGGLS